MNASLTTKQGERYTNRSRWMLIESQGSHQTSELVVYHRRKRIFLSLAQMEKEDPDQIQICDFRGQDFELIAD